MVAFWRVRQFNPKVAQKAPLPMPSLQPPLELSETLPEPLLSRTSAWRGGAASRGPEPRAVKPPAPRPAPPVEPRAAQASKPSPAKPRAVKPPAPLAAKPGAKPPAPRATHPPELNERPPGRNQATPLASWAPQETHVWSFHQTKIRTKPSTVRPNLARVLRALCPAIGSIRVVQTCVASCFGPQKMRKGSRLESASRSTKSTLRSTSGRGTVFERLITGSSGKRYIPQSCGAKQKLLGLAQGMLDQQAQMTLSNVVGVLNPASPAHFIPVGGQTIWPSKQLAWKQAR